MSSLSSSHLRMPSVHSLVHWLSLGGVAFDVGDEPASFQPPIRADEHETGPKLGPEFGPETRPVSTDSSHTKVKPSAARPLSPAKQAPLVTINIEHFTSLDNLFDFYKTWKALGLAKTASRAVLPKGSVQKPRLMVISDIPDDHEDRYGEAFSSPAHMAVRKALYAAGFAEQDILFTYLSKWRSPAKRPLTAPEADICMQLLAQEIALVDPALILTLGESTIRALSPDSRHKPIKNLVRFDHINQIVNKTFTVFASPKSDFLLKNAAMKKSFWFSLLNLANQNGA